MLQRKPSRIWRQTIIYGLGAGRLAQAQKIPVSEAQRMISDWKLAASGAAKWIQEQRNLVYTPDIQPTTLFGRTRHFVITDDNLNNVQNEYVNFPVQSVASDLTLFSLLGIHHAIERNEWPARIIITVHDSIVLEVLDDDELLKKVTETCKSIMRDTPKELLPKRNVPFKADAETGYTWGKLH